jgi:endo-1,4-beta-xylanase
MPALIIGFCVIALFMLKNSDRFKSAPELPNPPLKTLAAQKNIQIGTYAARDFLPDKPYKQILTSQFEYLIIDGLPNWTYEDGALRPSPTEYDFSRIDEIMDLARQNKMPVRLHHYVWGEKLWLPAWLKNGNYSKDQLLNLIEDHIKTVGGHYRGQVREWTVVNEAFTRKQHVKGLEDWWGERLEGTDYIDKAFVWAHEADPNSILLLNDFNNETKNSVSDAMYEYAKQALAHGVPISGIGMQMHLDGSNPPNKQDVIDNMKRFANLGLKVYVTEFDVNVHDLYLPDKQEFEIQAKVYKDMLEACVEVGSDVCPNFGLLGITDKQSWYRGLGIRDANPLAFDKDYNPKPAYFALRTVLD